MLLKVLLKISWNTSIMSKYSLPLKIDTFNIQILFLCNNSRVDLSPQNQFLYRLVNRIGKQHTTEF